MNAKFHWHYISVWSIGSTVYLCQYTVEDHMSYWWLIQNNKIGFNFCKKVNEIIQSIDFIKILNAFVC